MKQHLLWLLLLLLAGSAAAQLVVPHTFGAVDPAELCTRKRDSRNPLFHRLGAAPAAPAFESEGYWVWGSSMVQGDDGRYHLFVSRFPRSLPFHPGWMVASEIVHAVADTPEGPYRFSEVALPPRGAQYWDGRSTHNPRIVRHGGKYYLFYMGSTHPFEQPDSSQLTLESKWCIVGRANKRIGVAVADSPYGPWARSESPALDTKPGTFYSLLTSNPSPVVHADGSVVMIFKGRSYVGDDSYSDMALGAASAPFITGPYSVLNAEAPILEQNGRCEAEDPFLWHDADGYHIIFKDHVAQFTGEKGGGAMAHSDDGIRWTTDNDPKAYSLTVEWADGTVRRQGQLERPFIYFESGQPKYAFFATMDGPGGFENATRSWNMVIPIRAE